ncbi:MAG: DJ-1/PfpI family protein [Blastocatellia bacterium]
MCAFIRSFDSSTACVAYSKDRNHLIGCPPDGLRSASLAISWRGRAGGTWKDEEVVRDGNWVSSRQPSDIPAFNREMISVFSDRPARSATA